MAEESVIRKKFGFKKPDPDAQSKSEKNEQMLRAVEDAHEKALESARLCLHDPKFKKMLKDYKALEQETIDLLIRYANQEDDPIKFAFGTKDLLNKIESIRAMTVEVKTKAGKNGKK